MQTPDISRLVRVVMIASFMPAVLAATPLSAEASRKIKIGVSVPLSGEAATYGTDIKNALSLANEKLGGKFELIFEDDKCNGKDAADIAQKFVTIDRVEYAVGYACSGAMLAAAPILEKAKIVTIDVGGSSPAISQAGDHIFRTISSDQLAADTIFPYIAARHKKLGILSEETDYAQGFLRAFQALGHGKLQIENQNFLPGLRDFRTLLLKLKGAEVDSVLINPQSEAGLIAAYRQLISLNWKVPIYALYYPGTAAFLSQFGRDADGIIFADVPTFDEATNSLGKAFFAEFKAVYGPPASIELLSATSYLALDVLRQAIASGKDVKECLYTQRFQSIMDNVGFDSNGDITGMRLVLRTLRGGKPALLQ